MKTDKERERSSSNISSSSDFTKYGLTGVIKPSVTTALGRTKTFAGLHLKDWLFILVSVINVLAAVVLTIYRLVVVVQDDPKSSDFTFTILILINAAFSLFYVIHGLLREREYELYALIAAMLTILVYCIVEYAFLNVDGRTTVKLVRLIAACVLAPPNIYLAWMVARDFGWLQFKIIGASENLQNLYKQASRFSCLLKFDLQVTSSFVVLALTEGTNITLLEKVTLGIGIPFSLMWDFGGWIALRKEWKSAVWCFAVIGLIKPSYYFYKIARVYMDLEDDTERVLSNTIVYSLLSAGALAVMVWLMLMIELEIIYKNFGQGLRERAFDVITDEKTSLITGKPVNRKEKEVP